MPRYIDTQAGGSQV